MKIATATGMNMRYAPEIRQITVRTGEKDGYKTLSLADENSRSRGAMLTIVVNLEVKKLLKELCE